MVFVLVSAAIVLAVLFVTYRLVDPLPPRHLVIAAALPGSEYNNFARQYARILARYGVELEIRNSGGAVQDLDHDLLTLEAEGNYAGAKEMLDNLGVVRPVLKRAFEKLSSIPTDINPIFVTAESIAPLVDNPPTAPKPHSKVSQKRAK